MWRRGWMTVLLAALLPAAVAAGAGAQVSGMVFLDANGNGRPDKGEGGVEGVRITDGIRFARTDRRGRYRIDADTDPLLGEGARPIVTVSPPSGTRPTAGWFRRIAEGTDTGSVHFALRKDDQKLPFVFVHATDAHVPRAGTGRFIAFRQEMARLAGKVRFCILTGDNVNTADYVSFKRAKRQYDFFAEQTRDFPVPLLCLPGNHDPAGIHAVAGWRGNQDLRGYGLYRRVIGPLRWSFDYAGVHFVGIDFMRKSGKRWRWGVPASAVEWLREDLRGVDPSARVYLFVHYPEGPGALAEVVRAHGVRHIFAGHLHTVSTRQYAGVGVTLSGSLSRLFLQPGRLPGYRLVRITAEGMETMYKPTGVPCAAAIDHPPRNGSFRPGETIRGTVFDPDGAVETVRVTLGGAEAEAALRRGAVFSAFEARPEADSVKAGVRTVEVIVSDGRDTWSHRQKCVVLPRLKGRLRNLKEDTKSKVF